MVNPNEEARLIRIFLTEAHLVETTTRDESSRQTVKKLQQELGERLREFDNQDQNTEPLV